MSKKSAQSGEKHASTVADRLRTHQADATVLWQALHNDHWFVTGRQFYTFHEKTEELYGRWGQITDELAERLLMIDAKPLGTLKDVLKHATISERSPGFDLSARVNALIADITTIHEGMGKTIELAEAQGDRGTVNLLDEIRDTSEKNLWMLRAYNA